MPNPPPPDDARHRADPLTPGFRLDAWPFYQMNRAIRDYDGAMKRLLRSSGIDMPRWRILMIAHEQQPVSVGEVAGRAVMELSTATRAMQRLQAAGLIVVSTRASDQRVSEAVLTPRGRAHTDEVMKAASRVYHQAFDSFAPEEVALLNTMLERVSRNLREPV